MKDFIQNKLRILLEVVTNRDSDVDIPSIIRYGGPSHGYDSDEMYYMMTVAANLAKQMPPETLSTSYGNGGYEYTLTQTRNGNFILRGKPTTRYFEPGDFKLSDSGKVLYLYTMACSQYSDESCTIIYNPMVDAKIKILVDPSMRTAITDFIKDGSGYDDEKGAEIQAAKMSPDELDKLKKKEDLYAKRASQEKGYSGDEDELRSKLNDLMIQRRKISPRDPEFKTIRNIEKDIRQQLADIEKERRKRLSSNL
jgi:hypothetical protein